MLPLTAAQDAEVPFQRLRGLDLHHFPFAGDDGGEMAQAHVNTAHRPLHRNRVRYFLIHRHAHEPPVGFPAHRGRTDAPLHRRCFLQANHTQARQVHRTVQHVDGTRQPETVVPPLLLEPWEADVPTVLQAPEESAECPVQIPGIL